ncbi:hypothetical protein A2U01_0022597, partial [Trifolium medium]|nr:hypothetical protein [Trifolium medium]
MVQMAASGLNYDIRKRIFSQHLMDMSQLAESARQIEKLNAEKDKLKKSVKQPHTGSERYYRNDKERYPRKDKDHHIALVEEEEYDDDIDDDVPIQDIHLAELKSGPPY